MDMSKFSKAERDELKTLMKKFNWKSQEERQAFADTIVREIYDEILVEDISDLLADVIYYDIGDSMQFSNTRGIKAWVHEPGSYAPRSVLVKKTLTLYEKMTSINPQLNLIELEAGRYGTLDEAVRDGRKEILGARYSAMWNTFTGSITTGDPNHFTIAQSESADNKKVQLDAALRYCRDIGAKVKCIVGRYSSTDWIADVGISNNYYSEQFKEMRDREGILTVYKGTPVVYLEQYLDNYGQVRIGSGDIMIVAEGTGKLGIKFEIDKFVMENIDVDTYDWNMHAAEMWGFGIVFPERNVRIELT